MSIQQANIKNMPRPLVPLPCAGQPVPIGQDPGEVILTESIVALEPPGIDHDTTFVLQWLNADGKNNIYDLTNKGQGAPKLGTRDGKNVVELSGIADSLQTGSAQPIPRPFTQIVVGGLIEVRASKNQMISDGITAAVATRSAVYSTSAGAFVAVAGSAGNTTGSASDADDHVFVFVDDGATSAFFVDSTKYPASLTQESTNFDYGMIGPNHLVSVNLEGGVWVGSWYIIPRILADAEALSVVSFLRGQWHMA